MFGSLTSMSSPLRKPSDTHGAMMLLIAAAVIAASVASAFAFDISALLNNKPKQPDKFAVIRVDALASMIADSNSHVNIYDANGWALRSRRCHPGRASSDKRRQVRCGERIACRQERETRILLRRPALTGFA